ncbi:MAG: HlyC/CorC family transporter [Rhodospirillales bacterium]|nr:HlyC/CorC family transporter [Rhodospirillales bacterium]MCB9964970.1 HlyC/CorC family transporter [Rhodospirillales bacterium]
MELLISIAIIFLLLSLSAFFSGSETALTAASSIRMQNREKEGDKRAALVNRIREKKDRMIGALLLGNNLVNILASALATSVLIKLLGEAGVVYATLVMTMLVLIFAEVLPKTYALHHANTMSTRIAPILNLVIIVLAPVVDMVTWIVRQVLKLFGVDISLVQQGSHMELLRGVIEMHDGEEKEVVEQRAMLRSILDLADVEISEIMTHRKNVEMVDASQPIEEIIKDVLNGSYTRLPLYIDSPDNIIGVLHVKQLLREMHAHKGDVTQISLPDIASDPWFIPDTTALYDQLQAFRERKEHFALIVDEYGDLQGIVTLEDILEEIVGEIDDEHDVPVAGVRALPDGSYLVDGDVTIRDLNRAFEWNLPDEDYATLAGLVIHESKSIPETGQVFMFHDFRFDVTRRYRNQITMVKVYPSKPAPAAGKS